MTNKGENKEVFSSGYYERFRSKVSKLNVQSSLNNLRNPKNRVLGSKIKPKEAGIVLVVVFIIFAGLGLFISSTGGFNQNKQEKSADVTPTDELQRPIAQLSKLAQYPFQGKVLSLNVSDRILKVKDDDSKKTYTVKITKEHQILDVTKKKQIKLKDLKVGNYVSVVAEDDIEKNTTVKADTIYLIPEPTPLPLSDIPKP